VIYGRLLTQIFFGEFWYTLNVKNATFCQESDKTYIYENLEKKEENSGKKRKI
jgi:hypothetical protein